MSNKELSFNLGLGSGASSDVNDPEIASELFKIYNAINLLAVKLDEYTGALSEAVSVRPYVANQRVNKAANTTRLYAEATVDLVRGTVVYMNASGKLAKALPGSGGIIFIVLEDTATGNYAPIARNAVIDGMVGIITGTIYVVSTTAGAVATSVATGNTRRYAGFGVGAGVLYFCPDIIGVVV